MKYVLNSFVMHFTIIICNILLPDWTSFGYKAIIKIGRLGSVIPLGKNRYSVYFFQKTMVKDYFKFPILDFDLRLK